MTSSDSENQNINSDQLQLALGCIDDVEELLQIALRNIKVKCSIDGKLDSELLDQFQLVSYELAFSVAEIAAARALIAYAEQVNSSLTTQIALSFSAESLHTILGRMQLRSGDTGVSRLIVAALGQSENFSSLVEQHLDSNALAGLGEHIVSEEIMRLPSILDEEKELVRETFFRFANDVVMPLAEEIHREDKDIPEEILKPAAELGCFGTCIPERFGGLQPDDHADSLSMIVVTEELSRGSLGAAGSLITRPEIAARALLRGGTEEQQQRWLPKLAAGELLCAISITEPNTGSDVAAVSLKATATEGGWLLNGSKTWCTFAGRSELIVVLARTNPDSSLGYKGLSMFMLEKPAYAGHEFKHEQDAEASLTTGSLTAKAIATLGYRGMHSYDLFFEDYFVPAENLVGEKQGEGKGFYYTMSGFSGGRIQTAARATGVMQAAFEKALSYAKERQVFGKAVADYQLTQVKLARMLATLTASRQFSYAVAAQMDAGGGQMEASLVKLFTCRAAEWISREALQIHGGMGYAEESTVSRLFVDARVLSIFEGAEETLALKVIARELISRA